MNLMREYILVLKFKADDLFDVSAVLEIVEVL